MGTALSKTVKILISPLILLAIIFLWAVTIFFPKSEWADKSTEILFNGD